MIKVENIDVWGFEHAVRGMRNPLNSWAKSDSEAAFHMFENFQDNDPMAENYREWNDKYGLNIKLGKNDLSLMRRLFKAGSEHRKYLRQIMVSMDIVAPLYWWKEMDQYRINVTTNSCSTMHKIADKRFTVEDFSADHLPNDLTFGPTDDGGMWLTPYSDALRYIIEVLNEAREMYLWTKDKRYWWVMIQLLPTSYNQRRTVTMNYENVVTIIKQRSGHKLDEWNEFVEILRCLPYIEAITDE